MLKLFGSSRRHHPGKFPSVSINNNGTVVEVYQSYSLRYSDTIYYKVGQLDGEGTDMTCTLSEGTPKFLDNGRYPRVAINNENHVVEVHEGNGLRKMYYCVGEINESNSSIKWHSRVPCYLCWGKYPAVALCGDRVVVTYDRAFGSYTSYYCIGKFTADGKDVQWAAESHELFSGATETSVTMNERNIVIIGRGWTSIVCRVGRFQGSAIEFTAEIPFNYLGYSPAVCLDDGGYIILVWATTLRKLNYITTNIPNPECPSITWPKNDSIKNYSSGRYPTIAISPDGTKVFEEHETNITPYLYYRTGALKKPHVQHQLQGPAHQQEQVEQPPQPQRDPQPHEEPQPQEKPQPQTEGE